MQCTRDTDVSCESVTSKATRLRGAQKTVHRGDFQCSIPHFLHCAWMVLPSPRPNVQTWRCEEPSAPGTRKGSDGKECTLGVFLAAGPTLSQSTIFSPIRGPGEMRSYEALGSQRDSSAPEMKSSSKGAMGMQVPGLEGKPR